MNSTTQSELGFIGASFATVAVTMVLSSWLWSAVSTGVYSGVALTIGVLALALAEKVCK